MPPKTNPLKLNKLQLRTLAVLQELARHEETSTRIEESGEVLITMLPRPHGNHIHVGRRIVMTKNASGLWNEAVWRALERKGLASQDYPVAIRLKAAAIDYDTAGAWSIFVGSDH